MKQFTLVICFSLFAFACTEECCDDGNEINPDEINEVIDENENSNLFLSDVSGKLICLNGSPIDDVDISITDIFGNTFTTTTAFDGTWTFPNLEEGDYSIYFSNDELYEYTNAEYTSIIEDLRNIILSVIDVYPAAVMAYHMENADDGLTTLDQVRFARLQEGVTDISTVSFPWRYITKSDFETENYSITDNLNITLLKDETLELEVYGIYFGDTTGEICD